MRVWRTVAIGLLALAACDGGGTAAPDGDGESTTTSEAVDTTDSTDPSSTSSDAVLVVAQDGDLVVVTPDGEELQRVEAPGPVARLQDAGAPDRVLVFTDDDAAHLLETDTGVLHEVVSPGSIERGELRLLPLERATAHRFVVVAAFPPQPDAVGRLLDLEDGTSVEIPTGFSAVTGPGEEVVLVDGQDETIVVDTAAPEEPRTVPGVRPAGFLDDGRFVLVDRRTFEVVVATPGAPPRDAEVVLAGSGEPRVVLACSSLLLIFEVESEEWSRLDIESGDRQVFEGPDGLMARCAGGEVVLLDVGGDEPMLVEVADGGSRVLDLPEDSVLVDPRPAAGHLVFASQLPEAQVHVLEVASGGMTEVELDGLAAIAGVHVTPGADLAVVGILEPAGVALVDLASGQVTTVDDAVSGRVAPDGSLVALALTGGSVDGGFTVRVAPADAPDEAQTTLDAVTAMEWVAAG